MVHGCGGVDLLSTHTATSFFTGTPEKVAPRHRVTGGGDLLAIATDLAMTTASCSRSNDVDAAVVGRRPNRRILRKGKTEETPPQPPPTSACSRKNACSRLFLQELRTAACQEVLPARDCGANAFSWSPARRACFRALPRWRPPLPLGEGWRRAGWRSAFRVAAAAQRTPSGGDAKRLRARQVGQAPPLCCLLRPPRFPSPFPSRVTAAAFPPFFAPSPRSASSPGQG